MTDTTTDATDATDEPTTDTGKPSAGTVTVPLALAAPPGLAADTLTATVEIAGHWDARAWRRGAPSF